MITITLTEKQVATMLQLGTLQVIMGLIQAAEEDAPKVIKPKKEVKAHVEPVVEETEAQEDQAPAEPIEEPAAEVHYDTVKVAVAQKAAAGKQSSLRELFVKHGGTKLSDVPQANLTALYTEVVAL